MRDYGSEPVLNIEIAKAGQSQMKSHGAYRVN